MRFFFSMLQGSYSITSHSNFTLLILVIASLLFLLWKNNISKSYGKRNRYPLPPHPPKLPLIGNLHQLGHSPPVSLLKLSSKYGPLMLLHLGFVPTLVVSSPHIAKEIFKFHDLAFSNRPSLYALKKLFYNSSDIGFAPYGEHWREMRKITILELLSTKRVQSFEEVRAEEITLVLGEIGRSNCPINLSKVMLLLANNIVCKVAFGKKYEVGGNGMGNFYEILREFQNLTGGFCISDHFPCLEWVNKFIGLDARLEKTFEALDKIYDDVINEHLDPARTKTDHEDLVDVLLQLQRDPTQATTITNNHIKGVLADIFVAGTETSSATIVWAMTQLIKNPPVMRKAQDEVRSIVGNKGKVDESDLSRLNYVSLVVKETLRLHPPTPLLLPRETTEECIVAGYRIPAKTRVLFLAKALAMDPKYWDKPNKFYPERFMESCIEFKGQNFEFLPFGAGRRGCPGIFFGVQIIELALANLLYKFNWQLPHGMKAEDLDMEEAVGMTMHKKVPLCLIANPVN